MSEHTKAPWDYYVATMGGDDIAVIHPQGEPDDYRICTVFDEAGKGTSPEANARHIVHCVNNHERLVKALAKMHAIAEFRESRNHEVIAAGELLAALEAEKGGEL